MSDYTNWHVGMEVVCVDGRFVPLHGERAPISGRTYTIRTISMCPATGMVGIRLAEILNPTTTVRKPDDQGSREWGFYAIYFRPVQKRKTDISIFQRLLTHPRVTIGEDA